MPQLKRPLQLSRNIALILAASLSAFACSHYRFNTNLDKEPIKEYFAVGEVDIYQADELAQLNYQYLGTVEGESCQHTQAQAPANDSEARTHARQQATKMAANGIVFSPCISLEENTSDCITTRLCSGKAIKVIHKENNND